VTRKPPPRKKAVAKKKRQEEIAELISPKAAKAAERRLSAYVVSLDEKADERENYTKGILAANDDSVEEIVGWTVDILRRMEGEPKLIFEGQTLNAIKGDADLLKSIQTRNFRWIAVRMLVASALWDIQIGNFKLPKDKCARCLKAVKKPKPRRAVKK
jgi:hypothetical protein